MGTTRQFVEISKFLSYVLRHEPGSVGLELDREGWARLDALIAGAAAGGRKLDMPTLRAVVESSDKKRFALSPDGLRIRAVQGHSTDAVAIGYAVKEPPPLLYHGTATRFLASIFDAGLKPGERHHVHLSADVRTAVSVGQRHGTAVVLRVDAHAMHAAGLAFHQADNGVWLTSHVPPKFLSQE